MSEISLCLRNPMGGDNSRTISDHQAELWSTYDAILCDISHMIHMIEVGEIANKQACPSISEWIKESVLLRQNAVLAQDTSLIFKSVELRQHLEDWFAELIQGISVMAPTAGSTSEFHSTLQYGGCQQLDIISQKVGESSTPLYDATYGMQQQSFLLQESNIVKLRTSPYNNSV